MRRPILSPPPPYRPLSEEAYQALRDAILHGRLRPGERIVEAEVSRQMAISRGPIREAIRKLERDGLVEYLPRRGAVVAKLTRDDLRDAYNLRAHLEAYAVRLAVEHITPDGVAALEASLEAMRRCAARDDLDGLITADVAFHGHICRISGSKRAYRLWDSLNPHSWMLFSIVRITSLTLPQIAERHLPILDAIKARDADRAEHEVRYHATELLVKVLHRFELDDGAAGEGAARSEGR